MDTMMEYRPAGMEQITIRCRNRTNRIRILILTVVYTLVGWAAFGLACSLLENSLSFGQALFTPLAMIFLVFDLPTSFVNSRNQSMDR